MIENDIVFSINIYGKIGLRRFNFLGGEIEDICHLNQYKV